MTDKPDAGEAARRIVEHALVHYSRADVTRIARALLSSSRRIEELEARLREYALLRHMGHDRSETWCDLCDEGWLSSGPEKHKPDCLIVLSPSNGGGEMAQPQTASRSPATKPSDV